MNPIFFPPLSEVLAALGELAGSGEMGRHVCISLQRAGIGFALAVAVAIPLGFLMGRYAPFERATDLLVQMLRNTSQFTLLPVFVLLLGIGEASKVAITFYAAVFFLLVNTVVGVTSVDPLLLKAARSIGTSDWDLFRKVIFPSAIPSIVAGARLGVKASLFSVIAAEMLAARSGIGYLIQHSQLMLQAADMYAGILTLTAVGLSSWKPQNETVVIVRADSEIDSLDDLEGRNVAYLSGTVRYSTLAKALETVGLTTDDVESFNFGIETSGPALDRGDVDAIVESQSTVQTLVDQGFAKVIFDADAYPEWVSPFPIAVNGEFARSYPEVLARVLAVDIQTAAWADAHPEETLAAFAEGTGRPVEAVRETYPDGVFHESPEITEAALDSFKEEEAFMAANGLLEGEVNYDGWVDTSHYEAALALLQARTN